MSRYSRWAVLLLLLPGAVALAESEAERQAREDLERQLKQMVGTPPTKIKIEMVGLDQPVYDLVEAHFELDGRTLPVSNLKALNGDGDHLVFHGDVLPGDHRVEARLHYQNTASQLVSTEGGFGWKVNVSSSFHSDPGIEIALKVTPVLVPKAPIKDRFKLTMPATPKMLAKVDDGSMPARAERPKIAGAEPDAGVVVVKGESAAEKAAAAAEAKKKAREEAKAAKAAAAEEKRAARLAALEEKKAAKLAAAEEKKAAKLAAAEEKKRLATEALAAKQPKPAPVEAPPAAEVDAGPAVVAAAEVDAGAPEVAVAVAPPPKQVEPPPLAPVEEAGFPLPLAIGGGVALLGLILFVVARRRSRPPSVE